jgi:transposase-like protein
MSPPHHQTVTKLYQELGIHVITLYKWRKTWRLQGEVVPASQKEPEGGTHDGGIKCLTPNQRFLALS